MRRTIRRVSIVLSCFGCVVSCAVYGDVVDKAQADKELKPYFDKLLKNQDLAADCSEAVRTDFPGWNNIPLRDCKNTEGSGTTPKITLRGRTLLPEIKAERVVAWVEHACAAGRNGIDMSCAQTVACHVKSQSGGQFPVAGLHIEAVSKDIVVPENAPLETGVIPMDQNTGRSWQLVRTLNPKGKCTKKVPNCVVFTETRLINFIFSNGVTVLRDDFAHSSSYQLSKDELETLVANDAGGHVVQTATPDAKHSEYTGGPARILSTERNVYLDFVGNTQENRTSVDKLAWLETVRNVFQQALNSDDNPLFDAWIKSPLYRTLLSKQRGWSCQ